VKSKASGAQAVLTGNWGNDLTLLIKAAKDGVGFERQFYLLRQRAQDVPAAPADASVEQVIAVAEWFPNASGDVCALYQSFRQRFPSLGRLHSSAHAAGEPWRKALKKPAAPTLAVASQ
jgi:branched-chain amino acid transport system substrate-binding protein